ncbi:MAG: ribosome maturation factor RimP [Acidimicrobiales bacterium]
MSVLDRVHALVAPLCADVGVELFDVQHNGGVLQISVERDGGVDIDVLRRLTKSVSRALDEADPISGRYTLEISSPGLERTLRTPAHFQWAVDKQVKIKNRPPVEGDRRVQGPVQAADAEGVDVLDETSGVVRRLEYGDIDKARTVFEWGPTPKSKSARKATS